jgi:hypothetical protein
MSRLAPQGSKGSYDLVTLTVHSLTYPFLESIVYAQALHGLATLSYLKPSTLLSHISPRDKRILYETEEKAKITGFPTTKELRQAREAAVSRLKREEDEAENVGLVCGPICVDCAALQLMWAFVEIQDSSLFKTFQGMQCFVHHVQLLTFFVADQGF